MPIALVVMNSKKTFVSEIRACGDEAVLGESVLVVVKKCSGSIFYFPIPGLMVYANSVSKK